jgi:hypothetical protein
MKDNILPFAVLDRWIVTAESKRVLVKVRHRTHWFTVARRLGHDDQIHWVASEQDALEIAEMIREAKRQEAKFESDPDCQQFAAWFLQQPKTTQQMVLKEHRKVRVRVGKAWGRRACFTRDRHR